MSRLRDVCWIQRSFATDELFQTVAVEFDPQTRTIGHLQATVVVNHNQNANLTPNEKMLRTVCLQCHGLQFSMDALADRNLILSNFSGRPSEKHPGITWSVDSAVERGDERIIELKAYLESMTDPPPSKLSQP